MSNDTTKWFPTNGVSCGDAKIHEYRTDGIATPTAPRGAWTMMRGTDRDWNPGRVRPCPWRVGPPERHGPPGEPDPAAWVLAV